MTYRCSQSRSLDIVTGFATVLDMDFVRDSDAAIAARDIKVADMIHAKVTAPVPWL